MNQNQNDPPTSTAVVQLKNVTQQFEHFKYEAKDPPENLETVDISTLITNAKTFATARNVTAVDELFEDINSCTINKQYALILVQLLVLYYTAEKTEGMDSTRDELMSDLRELSTNLSNICNPYSFFEIDLPQGEGNPSIPIRSDLINKYSNAYSIVNAVKLQSLSDTFNGITANNIMEPKTIAFLDKLLNWWENTDPDKAVNIRQEFDAELHNKRTQQRARMKSTYSYVLIRDSNSSQPPDKFSGFTIYDKTQQHRRSFITVKTKGRQVDPVIPTASYTLGPYNVVSVLDKKSAGEKLEEVAVMIVDTAQKDAVKREHDEETTDKLVVIIAIGVSGAGKTVAMFGDDDTKINNGVSIFNAVLARVRPNEVAHHMQEAKAKIFKSDRTKSTPHNPDSSRYHEYYDLQDQTYRITYRFIDTAGHEPLFDHTDPKTLGMLLNNVVKRHGKQQLVSGRGEEPIWKCTVEETNKHKRNGLTYGVFFDYLNKFPKFENMSSIKTLPPMSTSVPVTVPRPIANNLYYFVAKTDVGTYILYVDEVELVVKFDKDRRNRIAAYSDGIQVSYSIPDRGGTQTTGVVPNVPIDPTSPYNQVFMSCMNFFKLQTGLKDKGFYFIKDKDKTKPHLIKSISNNSSSTTTKEVEEFLKSQNNTDPPHGYLNFLNNLDIRSHTDFSKDHGVQRAYDCFKVEKTCPTSRQVKESLEKACMELSSQRDGIMNGLKIMEQIVFDSSPNTIIPAPTSFNRPMMTGGFVPELQTMNIFTTLNEASDIHVVCAVDLDPEREKDRLRYVDPDELDKLIIQVKMKLMGISSDAADDRRCASMSYVIPISLTSLLSDERYGQLMNSILDYNEEIQQCSRDRGDSSLRLDTISSRLSHFKEELGHLNSMTTIGILMLASRFTNPTQSMRTNVGSQVVSKYLGKEATTSKLIG